MSDKTTWCRQCGGSGRACIVPTCDAHICRVCHGSGTLPSDTTAPADELITILANQFKRVGINPQDTLGNVVVADVLAEAHAAILEWVMGERRAELRRVYDAVKDMERSYPEAGRTLSKGEIIKWLEFELGIGTGRNG